MMWTHCPFIAHRTSDRRQQEAIFAAQSETQILQSQLLSIEKLVPGNTDVSLLNRIVDLVHANQDLRAQVADKHNGNRMRDDFLKELTAAQEKIFSQVQSPDSVRSMGDILVQSETKRAEMAAEAAMLKSELDRLKQHPDPDYFARENEKLKSQVADQERVLDTLRSRIIWLEHLPANEIKQQVYFLSQIQS